MTASAPDPDFTDMTAPATREELLALSAQQVPTEGTD